MRLFLRRTLVRSNHYATILLHIWLTFIKQLLWRLKHFPNELRSTIQRFLFLGLNVQVTELDVSVYPFEKRTPCLRPVEADEFTTTPEQQQMAQCKVIFRVLREFKNVISGVTFWKISDRHNWLDKYPVPEKKSYPLQFNKNLKLKKLFGKLYSSKNRTSFRLNRKDVLLYTY